MPICGPGTKREPKFVAPSYSIGQSVATECFIPLAYKLVLDWFLEVSNGGEEYSNPRVIQLGTEDEDEEGDEDFDEKWDGAGDANAWKAVKEVDGDIGMPF